MWSNWDRPLIMKRTEYRRSLQNIKKALDTTTDHSICNENSEDIGKYQNVCTCKDAQGHPKMLYKTVKEAEDTLAYLQENTLRIYPCPSESGWHLTKG